MQIIKAVKDGICNNSNLKDPITLWFTAGNEVDISSCDKMNTACFCWYVIQLLIVIEHTIIFCNKYTDKRINRLAIWKIIDVLCRVAKSNS